MGKPADSKSTGPLLLITSVAFVLLFIILIIVSHSMYG